MTTDNKENWLDLLLTKAGGDRQGKKDMRLGLNYAFWCLLWAGITVVSDITLEEEMIAQAWIWPMVLLPIVTAPIVFYNYYRFYCGVDELARKIQSNSLSLGFGVGIFYLIASMSLANVGFAEAGPNEAISVMAIGYAIASGIMALRYYK